MIKLFNSTDTLFSSNGDKIIISIRAKVHKEDNVVTKLMPVGKDVLYGKK